MIRVAVLGSTGSIGRSTLEVLGRHPDLFELVAVSAHRSAEELAAQVESYRPRVAVLSDPMVGGGFDPDDRFGTEWHVGQEALLDLVSRPDIDVVVNALVGFAGLEPTLMALRHGKRLALANKESLVAGGPLVVAAAEEGGGELIPVDSEHSAILQCLEGAGPDSVARLVLTASGGPFRGWERERLREVSPEEALCHPTWEMGSKITVDSATLANKALEVIEAHFLYGVPYDAIEVVVHPQSIVHSFVEFVDGSVLAQVGQPTMELPILYALSYPERVADESLRTFHPITHSPLTFEGIDQGAFPLFRLGVEAGRTGGVAPVAFNAGNEIAVDAFLMGTIGFLEMAEIVGEVLAGIESCELTTLDQVLEVDRQARALASATVEACRRA